MQRKKFDSEMSWEEYKEYYSDSIAALGAQKEWENYHHMRWGWMQNKWSFLEVSKAYLAIPKENNPYYFSYS